jgi:hypothetical protein
MNMTDSPGHASARAGTPNIESLRSVQVLRRTDGAAWQDVLEPVLRDTKGIGPTTPLGLDEFHRLIFLLLNELARYELPQFGIYIGPGDRLRVTPVGFASALVTHRAERLIQTAELAAGALAALEYGGLQLSAVASRALFELAVVCWDIHQQLLEPWRSVHGSIKRVRAEASSNESKTFSILWTTRMASRTYDHDQGWPKATSVLTRIERFNKSMTAAQEIYDMLCEATHPNIESHATLWRSDYTRVGEHGAIRFAPGRSNSPIKMAIVDAIRVSLKVMIPFVRDLWWVASDITNSCEMTVNEQTRLLGLPGRTRRNDQCSCGSGLTTRECTHPEPQFRPEIELAEPSLSGLLGDARAQLHARNDTTA